LSRLRGAEDDDDRGTHGHGDDRGAHGHDDDAVILELLKLRLEQHSSLEQLLQLRLAL
jgi:hypothetical protein